MERQTVQKTLVYDTVCAMHDHPTAQDIYEVIHEKHPSISRATVYRILGALTQQGRILKVPVADGADHFDFNIKDHVHFCCRSCGCVMDIHDTAAAPLVHSTNDYTIEGYTLLYHGICADCRRRNESFSRQ